MPATDPGRLPPTDLSTAAETERDRRGRVVMREGEERGEEEEEKGDNNQ
jgi:hypothetical protein